MNELRYAATGSSGASAAVSGFGASPAEDDPLPSAGTLLRAAREAAGLHIAALAVSLKVPVRKLEALEQDRTDLLPDAVFARALAASVCRSLKVDPAPVLARLPQSSGISLKHQARRAPTPFRSPGERAGLAFLSSVARPPVLACLVLLFGTLAVVFWPAIKDAGLRLGSGSDVAAVPVQPNFSTPLILELTGPRAADAAPLPAPSVEMPFNSNSPVQDASPSIFPTPPAPASMLPPASLLAGRGNVAAAMTPVGEKPTSSGAAQPAASAGIVTFSAKNQSWIEVTDARGTVVLRRMLSAGEVVGASGALPMAAVVGRADATQVEVRGKPLDLLPLSRDNVARFEVK